MYQFRIIAHTQTGESIGIVGSAPELGGWDIRNYLRLQTSSDRYPIWWTDDLHLTGTTDRIEYKYVRIDANSNASWEAWGIDRWIPIDPARREETIVIDDGAIGYLQPYPFGYCQHPQQPSLPATSAGLKIAVIGSSVAWGQKAWLLEGWAGQLGRALQEKYGHQVVNVAEVGANVGRTISRFEAVVTPARPDLVIIALSLGNEGFAHCHPRDRRTVQRRFESGLQQLVNMTRDIGARPILGGVYPHNDYHPEHRALLQETHDRMLKWGVPVLDWLAVLDDGGGGWQAGISFDPAHPNTLGHQLMFEAIDLRIFDVDRAELDRERKYYCQLDRVSLYADNLGFELWLDAAEHRVTIANHSPHDYTIAPYWQQLQTALQQQAKLLPGVYITATPRAGTLPFFAVGADGSIASTVEIPAGSELQYTASFQICTQENPQVFFDNGEVRIWRSADRQLWIINESDHEYNIQPMWEEVSFALKALPTGVYTDPLYPDLPFRTLTIGDNGLESRVKIPAQSAIWFEYHCKLSEIERIAILPLGDRCAVRMMLYKMQYDGPAFPFDLTRTTKIADIADIIDTGFDDMWNPQLLHYDAFIRRIYHQKWTGLSFAHEVEDDEHPEGNMSPVFERMRSRYTARSARFWYTLEHCDRALFIRTGIADRGGTLDLVEKLAKKCQGKPFQLMMLSPQSSAEFADIPHVLHFDVDFNPDRMYADLEHWLYCTDIMRGILDKVGVSSKNLFWCPPKLPAQ
jgi:lysophospholipase L1-like esterase